MIAKESKPVAEALPRIWLDHFQNIEHEWMIPLIIQQEENMLALAERIRMEGVHDIREARATAINMLMAATLGLQWRMAPGSQEQMVASMAIGGPWTAFRDFVRRAVEAEQSARTWRMHYLVLCVFGILGITATLLFS